MTQTPALTRPAYNICCAAAWQVLAELFRRYQRRNDFRLYETHPIHYDCLTVRVPVGHTIELRLHLSDGSVYVFPYDQLKDRSSLPKTYAHVASRREARNLADDIARAMGYGKPSSVDLHEYALVWIEVIAALMERYSTGRIALEARSVCFDSLESVSVRPRARRVPWAAERLQEATSDSRVIEIGRRVWRLNESAEQLDHGGFGNDDPDLPRSPILNFSTGDLSMLTSTGLISTPIGQMYGDLARWACPTTVAAHPRNS
jgi:hypothetical protein